MLLTGADESAGVGCQKGRGWQGDDGGRYADVGEWVYWVGV